MQMFVIDDSTIQAFERLRAHAEINQLSMDDMLDIKNKQKAPPGDDPDHTLEMLGYRVVFTHEWMPAGICRHLSVTYKEGTPHPVVVKMILPMLGFEREFEDPEIVKRIQGGRIIHIIEVMIPDKDFKVEVKSQQFTEKDVKCPSCGQLLDSVTGSPEDQVRDGAISICISCASILRLRMEGDNIWYELTEPDFAETVRANDPDSYKKLMSFVSFVKDKIASKNTN